MIPAGAVNVPPMSPDPAQRPLGTFMQPLGSGMLGHPLLRNQVRKDHLEGFSTMSQRVQGRVMPGVSWQ